MAKVPPKEDCFIISPIADPEGYPEGHFKHVLENIIKPACEQASVNPIRGDDVKQTNLIHLDIIQKLVESPIAICDLSNHNPNVLFELGIRQAFDKPVVLIQEIGTPKIFDIGPLRYLEYSREMKYHDVLSSQVALAKAISATREADSDARNVNSIVKLLALSSPATIPEIQGESKRALSLDIIQSEMRDMRRMFERFVSDGSQRRGMQNIPSVQELKSWADSVLESTKRSDGEKSRELKEILRSVNMVLFTSGDKKEAEELSKLKDHIEFEIAMA